jgi:hypothetical protein
MIPYEHLASASNGGGGGGGSVVVEVYVWILTLADCSGLHTDSKEKNKRKKRLISGFQD